LERKGYAARKRWILLEAGIMSMGTSTSAVPTHERPFSRDIILTYVGILIGFVGPLWLATAIRRWDVLAFAMVLAVGPALSIATLLAIGARSKRFYAFRLASALAACAAAFFAFFVVTVVAYLLGRGPVGYIILISVGEGGIIALVMSGAERLRVGLSHIRSGIGS
jgi:hypothetical protein